MDREEFLTMVIPEYEDVVTFYEDYGILLREWSLNNDILDEGIEENLAIITEINSCHAYLKNFLRLIIFQTIYMI